MILAAGRGERMRPLTDHTPKPLLKAGGHALIEWQLYRLAHAGVRQVVINHAWLGAQLPQQLGEGERYGLDIHYSDEGEALETAGGIARALPLLNSDYFIVTNGDVYTDFPYAQLLSRVSNLQAQAALAWLVLVPNPPHHPQGDFALAGQSVVPRLIESTEADTPRTTSTYTFSGIALYHRDLFRGVNGQAVSKLAPLLNQAIAQGRVGGECYTGCWQDIGTPSRLQALDAQLRDYPPQDFPYPLPCPFPCHDVLTESEPHNSSQ